MSFWKRFKSSVTGLFVSKSVAEANPATTYAQPVKRAVVNPTAVKKLAAKKSSGGVKPKSKKPRKR